MTEGEEHGSVLLLGSLALDLRRRELRRMHERLEIEPLLFDLLAHLVARRDRTCSRDEILETCWPGVTVTPSALETGIKRLRQRLGDDGQRQSWIATVRGQGYRYVGPCSSRHAGGSLVRPTSRPEFVGRLDVLGTLRAAIADAVSGSGSLHFLVGDPGVGKTRVGERVVEEASAAGCETVWGACREQSTRALLPWLEALGAMVAARSPEALVRQLGPGAADLAEVLPELRAKVSDLPSPEPLEPVDARVRLFEAVERFLRAAAEQRPLLVVLDDLQWADAASLELLEYVAPTLRRMRVVVLALHRDPEPRNAPFGETLGRTSGPAHVQSSRLEGLDADATREIVEGMVEPAPRTAFSEAVYRSSGGNPLFAQELVRLAAMPDGLRWEDDCPVWAMARSPTILSLVQQRSSLLDEGARRFLLAGAVLGAGFHEEDAAEVAALDAGDREEAVAQCTAARLLAPGDGTQLHFEHALFRDALLAGAADEARAVLHATAARVLAARHDKDPLEIAHHWMSAVEGGLPESLEQALEEGVRSLAASRDESPELAFRVYQRLVDALLARDNSSRERWCCELLIDLAEAHQPNDASVERAVELARQLGDGQLLARAVLAYTPPVFPGADPRWLPLHELVEEVKDELDPVLYATLVLRRAFVLAEWDPSERPRELMRAVWETVETSRDPGLAYRAHAAATMAVPAVSQRDLPVRVGPWEILDQCADPDVIGAEAIGALEQGLLAEAEANTRRLGDWARARRSPLGEWSARDHGMLLKSVRGDFDLVASQTHVLAEDGVRCRAPRAVMHYLVRGIWLAEERGSEDERRGASTLLEQSLLAGSASGSAWLTRMRAELGDRDEGLDRLQRAVSSLDSIPRSMNYYTALSDLSHACAELDARELAQPLYDRLLPGADLAAYFLVRPLGASARALARLAALLGRFEDAFAHLDVARRLEARLESEWLAAWTRLAHAEVLERRADSGDARRAADERAAALRMGEAAGLPRLCDFASRTHMGAVPLVASRV